MPHTKRVQRSVLRMSSLLNWSVTPVCYRTFAWFANAWPLAVVLHVPSVILVM